MPTSSEEEVRPALFVCRIQNCGTKKVLQVTDEDKIGMWPEGSATDWSNDRQMWRVLEATPGKRDGVVVFLNTYANRELIYQGKGLPRTEDDADHILPLSLGNGDCRDDRSHFKIEYMNANPITSHIRHMKYESQNRYMNLLYGKEADGSPVGVITITGFETHDNFWWNIWMQPRD